MRGEIPRVQHAEFAVAADVGVAAEDAQDLDEE